MHLIRQRYRPCTDDSDYPAVLLAWPKPSSVPAATSLPNTELPASLTSPPLVETTHNPVRSNSGY